MGNHSTEYLEFHKMLNYCVHKESSQTQAWEAGMILMHSSLSLY